MNQLALRHILRLSTALLLCGFASGLIYAQAPSVPTGGTPPAASATAPPTPPTPEPPEKVVLKVGDQQFTKAELDSVVANLNAEAQRTMVTQGRKQFGDWYALVVMLAQQARLHHLDQAPDFERKLALQKQQLEAQAAQDEMVRDVKVSAEEVSQYYATHATEFDEVVLRHFVVRKRAPNVKTGPGLEPDEAKTRAEALRKEVVAGTDIKKVMEDFKSPGDVVIEPEARPVRRGTLRPEMEKVAFGLKAGEVSEVFDVTSALVFFQVTAQSRADLKAVSAQIEGTLRRQKIDTEMQDLKKKTLVWMDDQYFAAPVPPSAGAAPGGPAPKPAEKP